MEKNKTKNRAGKAIVVVFLIFVIAIMSVLIAGQYGKVSELRAEEADLQEQLRQQEQRASELSDQESEIGTDEQIEDEARQRGWYYDDETVIKENTD